MNLYLSKIKDIMNQKVLDTEMLHPYICLNPKYKSVTLKDPNTKIIMDSGAFQDLDKNKRLSFEEALQRQLDFEKKIGFISEKLVSYDYIGNTEETLKANQFFASKREELAPRQLVFMAQGITVEEYVQSVKDALDIMTSVDCLGFGGVATVGRNKTIKEKLLIVLKEVTPLIKEKGIKDIHLFGVGTFIVLEEIRKICGDDFNISCDTSSFEVRSVMGNVIDIDTKKWVKVFGKEDKLINYHPCDLTLDNMKKAIQIIGGI